MMIRDEIMQMLGQSKRIPAPVFDDTNLYTDLAFDSLLFMEVLLRIEEAFSITFDIMEIEQCLVVGRLIGIVENKLRGCGCD